MGAVSTLLHRDLLSFWIMYVAAYQAYRGNKNGHIRKKKYFLTYTARFEINNKPCNNNSTDKT